MAQKDLKEVLRDALAVEAEDARQAGQLGYMARTLIQATLPHSEIDGVQFTRNNGAFQLSITALNPVGLPYGSIPRLLLSWMTTEAVRTHDPVLILGPTLSAFMAEMGLGRHGGKRGDITRFRNQTVRLLCSAISCRYTGDNVDIGANFNIADEYDLWWSPKEPDQLHFWESKVTLGAKFFKEITDKPVPIDMLALRALKRSPMALDIYFWLTYRMSYLRKDTVIPWPLLQMQFGADYAETPEGLRNFKKKFLQRLQSVQKIYENAKVFSVDNGLLLKPSPPHIAKRPISSLDDQRRKIESISPPQKTDSPKISLGTLLQTETYEKAKRAAPGYDVYALEQDWRDWITKTGKHPNNPDAAFLGFCRRKAKQSPL